MSAEFPHQLPGQYLYDEMVMGSMHPRHIIDRVPEFDMSGDVLLASYPKTGTTWMQELLWLLTHEGDTDRCRRSPLVDRFPHLEFSLSEDGPHEMDKLAGQERPRLIKTHLPVRFFGRQLSQDVRVVVTVRNPKDTLVSLYHFYRMNVLLGNFTGSWDEFFLMYRAKHMYYGDFFDWYAGWWDLARDSTKILVVKYEDMQRDLRKVAENVAKFLKISLPEDKMAAVLEHLQFANMKQNTMTNFARSTILKQDISPFMRRGVVGDWKTYFSQAQSEFVDRRYEDTLRKAGLVLEFE